MQIVIDISDRIYKISQNRTLNITDAEILEKALRNGTPLPKGHGRIGDLDALRKEISSWGMNDYEPSDFIDEIDMADAIIKAESEG